MLVDRCTGTAVGRHCPKKLETESAYALPMPMIAAARGPASGSDGLRPDSAAETRSFSAKASSSECALYTASRAALQSVVFLQSSVISV